MELTEEQIEFLDKGVKRGTWTLNEKGEVDVDGNVNISSMNLTEIPVKFGSVSGYFYCSDNNLTTLKNCPNFVGEWFNSSYNPLTNYFKNIKEEDFPHWDKLSWDSDLNEHPFLINIGKKYLDEEDLKVVLDAYPLTKIYLK